MSIMKGVQPIDENRAISSSLEIYLLSSGKCGGGIYRFSFLRIIVPARIGTMRNDIAVNAERQAAICVDGWSEYGGEGGHRTRIGRMLLASTGTTSYLLLLSARPATAKEPTGSW